MINRKRMYKRQKLLLKKIKENITSSDFLHKYMEKNRKTTTELVDEKGGIMMTAAWLWQETKFDIFKVNF